MKIGLVAMTILASKETLNVEVALVAANVVVDMVAVGIATMDLAMMETILEFVEATMILAIIIINPQILNLWQEETLRAKALAPVVVVANTVKNHEVKVNMVVPTATVTMTVVEGFNCHETA